MSNFLGQRLSWIQQAEISKLTSEELYHFAGQPSAGTSPEPQGFVDTRSAALQLPQSTVTTAS